MEWIPKLLTSNKEMSVVVFTNSEDTLLEIALDSYGTRDRVAFSLDEILNRGNSIGAKNMYLLHNHPCQRAYASKLDESTLKKISIIVSDWCLYIKDVIIFGNSTKGTTGDEIYFYSKRRILKINELIFQEIRKNCLKHFKKTSPHKFIIQEDEPKGIKQGIYKTWNVYKRFEKESQAKFQFKDKEAIELLSDSLIKKEETPKILDDIF